MGGGIFASILCQSHSLPIESSGYLPIPDIDQTASLDTYQMVTADLNKTTNLHSLGIRAT